MGNEIEFDMTKLLLPLTLVALLLQGCGGGSTPPPPPPAPQNLAPEITLIGTAEISVTIGEAFTDPGARATDDNDGNIDVVVTGSVNPDILGDYVLTYMATDSAGLTSRVDRVVTVASPTGEFILNSPTDKQFLAYLDAINALDPDGDEDGDGLTNSFEINALKLVVLPDVSDTDGDGRQDSEEDIDGDGLIALDEQSNQTNPLLSDTDTDGLNDKIEIDEGTDPLNPDSDGDSLGDNLELILGLDPLLEDTDSDGRIDSEERIFNYTETDIDSGFSLQASVAPPLFTSFNVATRPPEDHEALIPGLKSEILQFMDPSGAINSPSCMVLP